MLSRIRPEMGASGRTSAKGHEDPFLPRWLNVRCVIRHGTFARMRRNGRDAPVADPSGRANSAIEFDPKQPSRAAVSGALADWLDERLGSPIYASLIVGVVIHVVAAPDLARSEVAAPIMRDDA